MNTKLYEDGLACDGLIHGYLSTIIPEGWDWFIVDERNRLYVYPEIGDACLTFTSLNDVADFFNRYILDGDPSGSGPQYGEAIVSGNAKVFAGQQVPNNL